MSLQLSDIIQQGGLHLYFIRIEVYKQLSHLSMDDNEIRLTVLAIIEA